MYKQTLYKVHTDHLKSKEVRRNNRYKKYKYGHNSDLDCIVISHSGTIGEIYEIQGLRIALPMSPKEIQGQEEVKEDQVFKQTNRPSTLHKIKSIYDFHALNNDLKEKYIPFINQEFDRRNDGYWFMCNGTKTYLTGTHYVYLNWTKIDVGAPDFRQANRIFYYFWEACKADRRSYGMCYLKNRRSGFSFMASCETVNQATITTDARFGVLSKTGADAKKMFTDKIVPISLNYPFFFKPVQDGMERPKTELSYKVPSRKLTRNSLSVSTEEIAQGLDTTIDWKNTGDNSYDGEKLKLLVHDESGKWEKPDNILNNWRVTKTCLRLGSKIVGKCMMGSTSNALAKGGQNFKDLYNDSNLTTSKRNRNGQTPSGLYSLFLPMEWGYEGYIDKYGFPVFDSPKEPVEGIDGELIYNGVIEHWENEVDGLKHNSDGLNEYYRQFPRTEQHAFRDEAINSLFDLAKIYDQIDYNEEMTSNGYVTQGSFHWSGKPFESEVDFHPNKSGRFYLSWLPPKELRNKVRTDRDVKYPNNADIGAFGCDSYDISGTVGGKGSKGALHGVTGVNVYQNIPNMNFFLEYVARPQTAETFFDDVLKACVFYSMPILIENNKPRLLYYFKRHGYRGFCLNRPDKPWHKLSVTEKELGGVPNSSEDIRGLHANLIEQYIVEHVGRLETEDMGEMYFNRTLLDWAGFDITKRTAYDASISSGLALMAIKRNILGGSTPRKKIEVWFPTYNKDGDVRTKK